MDDKDLRNLLNLHNEKKSLERDIYIIKNEETIARLSLRGRNYFFPFWLYDKIEIKKLETIYRGLIIKEIKYRINGINKELNNFYKEKKNG